MITKERLRELYTYRDDGCLMRNSARAQCKAGSVAGSNTNSGCRRMHVDGEVILLHRAIFLYHHGYLPEQVDHKNGNRMDNRIENLRAATLKQNRQNRRPVRNGLKGAFKLKNGTWMSQIKVDGKAKYLGVFRHEVEAARAYDAAAVQYFGDFARTNF